MSLFDVDVNEMESRIRPQADNWIQTYGTIDCGLELMRDAWQRLAHVFSIEQEHLIELDSMTKAYHGPRFKLNILRKHPVNLLVVERGHLHRPDTMPKTERWEMLVANAEPSSRPIIILESWDGAASTWDTGPAGQSSRVRWEKLGYNTRMKLINATTIGGAIRQQRLMLTRIAKTSAARDMLWDDNKSTVSSHTLARPMSNLLTPEGLIGKQRYSTDINQNGIDSETEPMPPYQAWIRTRRGVRRLRLDELARGLGMEKSQVEKVTRKLSPAILQRTTSTFHWEYLSIGLATTGAIKCPRKTPVVNENQKDAISMSTVPTILPCEGRPPYHWAPPDLRIGSHWYKHRLINLMIAANTYNDSYHKLRQGIQMLNVHRRNYTPTHPDPKELQILWWEFPPEHWNDLREGSSMNFLAPPPAGLTPNGEMNDEQRLIAGEFVDELLALKVLKEPPSNCNTVCNAPLFILPKEGQPGQWRCIANLLEGGQNSVVGNDPVFLPRVSHILTRLYTGGYSAIVDASKCFYQFSTRPEERKYLGMIHPITGKIYEYCGLPMGAGNSPALGSRYGLAFVRLLKARFKIFQGQPKANCWWSGFTMGGSYDPLQGYGHVLIGTNGKPCVQIWVFVDDFLIHGPDYESTATALTLFLDTAVTVGLLCHPGKLTPPQQEVKYCGFLLNTSGVPRQIMQTGKRERALAMTEYILESPIEKVFSRLALAVVAGVLESLVDGTPHRFGHTHLRHTHSLVHPPGMGSGALPYYTTTTVPTIVRTELKWWSFTLRHQSERTSHSARSATLVPTWGDGSGTGTGGTLGLPEQPLHMWLGKWSPVVYKFSSNWKELRTLLLTMQQLKREHAALISDTTIFYFTDNSTTYWIAAAGSSKWEKLHSLITEIKLIEQELRCSLQVIHVPGLLMIQQGTDGLSRGVWMSPLHHTVSQDVYTRAVFDPVPYCSLLAQQYVTQFCSNEVWVYQPWDQPWDTRQCLSRLTVWFPPPELARQAIAFMLETWVECPLTTSALFFIPRILLSAWRGLSRHLVELDCIRPHLTNLVCPPTLPIPIIVLHLPRHTRMYSTPRMDSSTPSYITRWHREQATHMRGLPPRLLPETTSKSY